MNRSFASKFFTTLHASTVGLVSFLISAAPAHAVYEDLPYRKPSPNPREIAGAYMPQTIDRFIPNDGSPIPLTEWGRKILDERVAAEKEGRPLARSESLCLPHGVPRILISPYPLYIYQVPGEVLFIH